MTAGKERVPQLAQIDVFLTLEWVLGPRQGLLPTDSQSGCGVVTPPSTCWSGLASVLIVSRPVPAPRVGNAHSPDQLHGTSAPAAACSPRCRPLPPLPACTPAAGRRFRPWRPPPPLVAPPATGAAPAGGRWRRRPRRARGRQEGGPSVAGRGWRVLWWTVGARLVWVGRLVVVAGGESSRRRWRPSSVEYVGDAPAHFSSWGTGSCVQGSYGTFSEGLYYFGCTPPPQQLVRTTRRWLGWLSGDYAL